jgi:hypothetical protein
MPRTLTFNTRGQSAGVRLVNDVIDRPGRVRRPCDGVEVGDVYQRADRGHAELVA